MVSVVSYHRATRAFTAEEPPPGTAEPELSVEALRLRVRQQELLAEYGVLALKGTPFQQLLHEAAAVVAQGLKAEFAKVLKYMPEQNRFLVCAGVGWDPGVVGTATIGADTESPAGYALQTGKAVISNHLDIEERFRTPELLLKYGIRRAMNVILEGDGSPFGVLEVDSRSEGEFSRSDIVFLQGVANILGMAIERQRIEADLRGALDRQQLLLKESNHRVNNSLQIVAAMLHLQSSNAENPDLRRELREAGSRIAAVARAHQRLYSSNRIDSLDLGVYLTEVCKDLNASIPDSEINVTAEQEIIEPTGRAVAVALLVNELVSNAMKHAYPGARCRIWVTLARKGGSILLTVRDVGVGLPADFDLRTGRRLGMRLVNAFTKQLQGDLKVVRRNPGTEFVVTIPEGAHQ
jgi:two-component sensor histidine kinase